MAVTGASVNLKKSGVTGDHLRVTVNDRLLSMVLQILLREYDLVELVDEHCSISTFFIYYIYVYLSSYTKTDKQKVCCCTVKQQ